MSIREELEAMETRLKGIKAPREPGHNFGRSRLAKLVRGESDKAPPEIYNENMASESQAGANSQEDTPDEH